MARHISRSSSLVVPPSKPFILLILCQTCGAVRCFCEECLAIRNTSTSLTENWQRLLVDFGMQACDMKLRGLLFLSLLEKPRSSFALYFVDRMGDLSSFIGINIFDVTTRNLIVPFTVDANIQSRHHQYQQIWFSVVSSWFDLNREQAAQNAEAAVAVKYGAQVGAKRAPLQLKVYYRSRNPAG